jgi:hypothetical protein
VLFKCAYIVEAVVRVLVDQSPHGTSVAVATVVCSI